MLKKIWFFGLIGILFASSIHSLPQDEGAAEVTESDGEDSGDNEVRVEALATTEGPCACTEKENQWGKKNCMRPLCSEVPECDINKHCRGIPMPKMKELEAKRAERKEAKEAKRAKKRERQKNQKLKNAQNEKRGNNNKRKNNNRRKNKRKNKNSREADE